MPTCTTTKPASAALTALADEGVRLLAIDTPTNVFILKTGFVLNPYAVFSGAQCHDWSGQVRIASRSIWRTPPPRPEGASVCRVGVPNPLIPEQVG
jgi:hypothetical protein